MTLVLMLPGQGSQFPAMGSFLHDSDRTFRRAFDDVLDSFGNGAGELVRVWRDGTRQELSRGPYSQPLLFAVAYAAGRTLLPYGDDGRTVLVGHSVGELAAATLAGVFDVALAGELLRERADLLGRCPAGGMVGCRADPGVVLGHLRTGGLAGVIGAENAANQCVVSAGEEEVPRVVALLRGHGIACMRVAAAEPFHSPLLAGSAALLGDFLTDRAGRLAPPRRPLLSAYSGGWVGGAQACRPRFWTDQMARPVHFGAALSRVDAAGTLFVEAGPGTTLTTAAGATAHVLAGSSRAVAALPGRTGGDASWATAVDAVRRHGTASR